MEVEPVREASVLAESDRMMHRQASSCIILGNQSLLAGLKSRQGRVYAPAAMEWKSFVCRQSY